MARLSGSPDLRIPKSVRSLMDIKKPMACGWWFGMSPRQVSERLEVIRLRKGLRTKRIEAVG